MAGALDVQIVHQVRALGVALDVACQVVDARDALGGAAHILRIGERALDELDAQIRELKIEGAREHAHLLPTRDELLDEVAAQETGAACD